MKRIRYFDLLRCISFCFIIFYHMISQLYFSKLFPLDKILPFYENDNRKVMAAQAKLTPPLQKTGRNDKINPIIREISCFTLE